MKHTADQCDLQSLETTFDLAFLSICTFLSSVVKYTHVKEKIQHSQFILDCYHY